MNDNATIYDTQLQGLTVASLNMNVKPDIVLHGLRITPTSIIYHGEELEDAGAVHMAMMAVLNGGTYASRKINPAARALLATMPAQALARTSIENVQDVLDALRNVPGADHLDLIGGRDPEEPKPSGTAELIAAGALRQLGHNDGSDGFVFAYDKDVTDRVLSMLTLTPKPAYIELDDDAPLRDQLGRAISAEIHAGAEEPDWNDSREVDRLANVVLQVLQQLGADTTTEAAQLAKILQGMCEGGPADPQIDIYAQDFAAGDGDVYVQRAAQLVLEQAGMIAKLQRKNGFVMQLNGKQGNILRAIRIAIVDYYAAMSRREHGAVAMDRALRAIQNELGMEWDQGRQVDQQQPVKDGPAAPAQD